MTDLDRRCIAPGCKAIATLGAVFCDSHLSAPTGQRGGWISAHRRRMAIANAAPTEQPLDASSVARRLWLGGAPPFDRDLPKVDALVLAAREIQPASVAFHGLLYRCPLPESGLQREGIHIVTCVQSVLQLLAVGKTVLVTCSNGHNRAALIVGVVLGQLARRMSADDVVAHLRKHRRSSAVLAQPEFRRALEGFLTRKQRR